ncbi:MAG: manganese efflux pump MntP family protein [Evtepia sp.]
MNEVGLLAIAIGLSMDAFAVSICKGVAFKELTLGRAVIVGLWFGGFQALMPLLGYFLGAVFGSYVLAFDHWLAFVLLCLIGANMIREAFSKEEERADDSLDIKVMFTMAVATSIDAFAVGITFALLPQIHIGLAVCFIGVITFLFSVIGVKIGHIFGAKYRTKAELLGGIILIGMGVKILIEHLIA